MNLQRRVYANRGEKVVDFVIGVVIWHVINIVLGVGLAFLGSMLAGTTITGSGPSTLIESLNLVLGCLPFLLSLSISSILDSLLHSF